MAINEKINEYSNQIMHIWVSEYVIEDNWSGSGCVPDQQTATRWKSLPQLGVLSCDLLLCLGWILSSESFSLRFLKQSSPSFSSHKSSFSASSRNPLSTQSNQTKAPPSKDLCSLPPKASTTLQPAGDAPLSNRTHPFCISSHQVSPLDSSSKKHCLIP